MRGHIRRRRPSAAHVAEVVRQSPARAEPHDANAWFPVAELEILPNVDELLAAPGTDDASPARDSFAQPSPARAEPHDATSWLPLPDLDALSSVQELLDPSPDAAPARDIAVTPSPARAEPHDATAWLPLPDLLPEVEDHPADAQEQPARRRHLVRNAFVGALVLASAAGGYFMVPKILDAGDDVRIQVDERVISTETGVSSVASVLKERKIALGEHDRVTPGLNEAIENDMTIRVYRAFPIIVDFDGNKNTVYTTLRSPDDLLKSLKFGEQVVLRDAPTTIAPDMTIVARTTRLVTLIVDGSAENYQSPSLTARELLAEYSVVLGPQDFTDPPLDSVLPDNGAVRVTRQGDAVQTRPEPYSLPDQTAKDPTLDVGTSRVEPAVIGTMNVTYRQKVRDGQVIGEEAISRIPAPGQVAKPKITYNGTKADPRWDRMARCETGGNWAAPGPTYQGGLGIYYANWNHYGGREFAPTAGQATREQQIIVAERIRKEHGWHAWGCAKRIGA